MDTATLDSTATTPASSTPAPSGAADSGASTSAGSGSPSIIESGSDLLASVPANIFAGLGDEDSDTDIETDPGDDLGSIGTEDEEEPEGDTEEETAAEGSDTAEGGANAGGKTAEAKPGEQTEELPEGVSRGKNSSGKPGLFVEDSRWRNIYGNHQLVQKTAELLGEQPTLEGLQMRNEAYMAQEQLFHDLTSGDPQAQGALLNYFFDEIARAKEQGEVGVDAAVPLAQTFYSSLRERSPDGYAHLRMSAARDLIDEMFTEAAESKNDNLRLSAQHFAKRLAGIEDGITDPKQVQQMVRSRGLPFYTKEDIGSLSRTSAADPLQALREENARLRSAQEGTSATNQAAQRGAWIQETDRAIGESILNDAVKPALASVEKEWGKFPQQFQRLVADPLHRQVVDVIKADKAFEGRIKLLRAQAIRAPSAQKRAEYGQVISKAYLNRAKLAVDAVKGGIFRDAAEMFQERVNTRHERRSAAQNRTAPNGSNGTVPRSVLPKDLIPFQNGEFDVETAVKQGRQLLGG